MSIKMIYLVVCNEGIKAIPFRLGEEPNSLHRIPLTPLSHSVVPGPEAAAEPGNV